MKILDQIKQTKWRMSFANKKTEKEFEQSYYTNNINIFKNICLGLLACSGIILVILIVDVYFSDTRVNIESTEK